MIWRSFTGEVHQGHARENKSESKVALVEWSKFQTFGDKSVPLKAWAKLRVRALCAKYSNSKI